MRRIVLIDGENLVYGLRNLLGTEKTKADRSMVNQFNFKDMVNEILADNLPSEILWFGARLRVYDDTEELKAKSEAAIRIQSAFANHLRDSGIQFIKVGYLRARETDPCKKCGHHTWRLAEKGVDVGLVVRMLNEANDSTEIVVISADTDLLPAFKASKKLGAKLMHIGYEYRPITALSNVSDTTRTITLPLAQKYKKS